MGPGLGRHRRARRRRQFFTGNYVQPPQAIYHRDGDVERCCRGQRRRAAGARRGSSVSPASTITISSRPRRSTQRAPWNSTPVTFLPGPAIRSDSCCPRHARFPQPPQDVRFFVGPKQFDVLRAVDPELVRAIYFGMFGFLAVPLLSALKWVHGFVGNYGWSIIVLTILINLVIFPAAHKSVVSMRKMQAIQPQMKAIQDRYARLKMTDPARQKMNTEIMSLYQERGVNPASGCVPMLLTMPVLFAFYSLLSQSIELRGAPFVGWITISRRRIRYYVTPVLMGATMFWQQKITPSTPIPRSSA